VPVTRMQGDTLAVAAAPLTVRLTPDGVEVDGEDAEADARYPTPDPAWWDGFAWVQPQLQERYPVMARAEARRRLTADQILRYNPTAVPTLTQTDPDGDVWRSSFLQVWSKGISSGVRDATYPAVTQDYSSTYFRVQFVRLGPPDASGFQPHSAALAIDTEPAG